MPDVFPVADGSLQVIDLKGGFHPVEPPSGVTQLAFRTIVSGIHTYYLHEEHFPAFEEFLTLYKRVTKKDLAACWESEELQSALAYRGIDWTGDTGLTMQQENVLMAMSDPTDKRSPDSILRGLGVSGTTYRTWLRNPLFKAKLEKASVSMYADYLPGIRKALVSNALSGQQQAIELIYKITGEWSPETQAIGDLRAIVQALVESVVAHVKDEDAVRAILADAEKTALISKLTGPKALEA